MISGGLQAQVVTIPDPNFLAKLITIGVDTNNDGQIQQSEALAQNSLNVASSNISSLVGIEAFTNLTSLICSDNQLTGLDVTPLVNLTDLNCGSNLITSLDVSTLVNLTYLQCRQNHLTSLDVTPLVNLIDLRCDNNQLTSLDVSTLVNLIRLNCSGNQLITLDTNPLLNLIDLSCINNQLTSLNVSGSLNLASLFCDFNQLTNLDVSTLLNLYLLNCEHNQLTILDVSNLTNLTHLYCGFNQLSSLDVNNFSVMLMNFSCGYNPITSTLDLSRYPNLGYIFCDSTEIPQIFIKNGKIDVSIFSFSHNQHLRYICADANELSGIQTKINQYGLTNITVNSFCSYTPGAIYNTVSGKAWYDADMNGCSPSDSAYNNFLMIGLTNGVDSGYTCTNLAGEYTIYLDSGHFVFTPKVPNSTYFSASPSTANVYFANDSSNLHTQDYCIAPNGVYDDVEISLIPLDAARPGFDASYSMDFHNKGTSVAAGTITLDFMGNKMSFLSASATPSSQTTNQLTWAYSNLQPFETRSITFTMNILPPPTNNLNNVLTFNANISLPNDVSIRDNDLAFNQTVVGAFDPNDKTCLEGKKLNNSQIGEYLHYLIRFQNTGNYPAENVIVTDALNSLKYDMSSLQILKTSHPAHIDLKKNVLQFYFENIQLADSFSNEPASHGYVLFKIKTKATLPLNSSVVNNAKIYFDYNLPIITNNATTVFAAGVGIEDELQKAAFQCFPNPAHNQLNITTSRPIAIEIVNVLGESLISKQVQDTQIIDIATLPTGMYWIKEKNTGIG